MKNKEELISLIFVEMNNMNRVMMKLLINEIQNSSVNISPSYLNSSSNSSKSGNSISS